MKVAASLLPLAWWLIGSPAPVGAASDRPLPHVIILVADDMGYGDPGCYNPDSKIPTPNIDRLAREGLRFADAHAPGPLCHVSRYGLITGRYPFRINANLWPRQPLVQPGQTTIASLLRSQGYRTAMIGKWHLGFREDGYEKPLPGGPVDCGFDSFFGIRASTDIPPYFYIRDDRAVAPPTGHIPANASEDWSPIQGAFWREGGIAPGLQLEGVLPRFTDEAVALVEDHARREDGRPLMLYVAYSAPHTPWLPSPKFEGRSGAGLYGDFAAMVDAEVGRVLDALHQTGMEEDTLLIFTSDNGPVWYDADVKRFQHDSAGGLRGMKADVWEAGHRMPFLVRWPIRVKAGSVSRQLICFTDLLATFADLCGVELAAGQGPDSVSFFRVLTGEQADDEPVRSSLVMKAGTTDALTVRMGPWKLVDHLGSGGFSTPRSVSPGPGAPAGQLYHLDKDPGETHNLYAKHPEIVSRLEAELRRVAGGEAANQHP